MTITIPEPLGERLTETAKRLGYGSVDEYIVDLVDAEEPTPLLGGSPTFSSREELESLLLEGIKSGKGIEADEQYWKQLREKIEKGTLRRAENHK